MKKGIDQITVRITSEIANCFEDNDNGSSLLDEDNYEESVKDFMYGLILATGVILDKLTGNSGDNIDTISMLTRIVFEYSNKEVDSE